MAEDDAGSVTVSGVTINLAGNDQDADDGIDPGSITIVNGPQNGSVTVNPDGTVTYTPNIGDSFTYTIRDASGAVSNTATVTIQIGPQ